MPPSNAQRRRNREAQLRKRGITGSPRDFAWLARETDRINIVTEGDSWFAYPRKWLLAGPNSNVIDWVVSSVGGKDKANLLRLAVSGDEAVNMIAGEQKHRLAEIFQSNNVHLLLFSGGGNDVVGKWDMERLLAQYQPGFTAAQCLREDRLNRKLQRITLAYKELLEIRNDYSPEAVVVTHTYDYLTPSGEGASFLWGLVRTKPWISPYMIKRGIPDELQVDVCRILMERMRDCLQALAGSAVAKNRLVVVDTQGTLRPGHKRDWLNEIHPTSSGFKRIAKKIYAAMKEQQPGLPAFDG